jgi:hypothetical protein
LVRDVQTIESADRETVSIDIENASNDIELRVAVRRVVSAEVDLAQAATCVI